MTPLKRAGLTRPNEGTRKWWYQNADIMSRLEVQLFMRNQGYLDNAIYNAVCQRLISQGKKPITWQTFRKDKERCNLILREKVEAGALQHYGSLQQLNRELWQDYMDLRTPLDANGQRIIDDKAPRRIEVRSKVAGMIQTTVKTMAEIDGSLTQRISVQGEMTVSNEPTDEEIYEAARLAVELIPDLALPRDVIDVTPNEVQTKGLIVAPDVEVYDDDYWRTNGSNGNGHKRKLT